MVPEALHLSDADIDALSANHDWAVCTSWASPLGRTEGEDVSSASGVAGLLGALGRGNAEARRGSMVAHLRMRMAVPRILMYTIQGDVASLTEQVAKYRTALGGMHGAAGAAAGAGEGAAAEAVDAVTAGMTSLSLEEIRSAAGGSGATMADDFRAHCRTTALYAFDTAIALNTQFKSGGAAAADAAAAELAAAMLADLGGRVAQLGPFFQEARCTVGIDTTDGSSPPMTALWLACVSYFVENLGSWLCTLVQVRGARGERREGRGGEGSERRGEGRGERGGEREKRRGERGEGRRGEPTGRVESVDIESADVKSSRQTFLALCFPR